MIKTSMLIIDKRIELGTKYKKACAKLVSKVFLETNIQDAFTVIIKYEPDLILISDSFEQDFPDITEKIRSLTSNYRPTIVYISKSSLIDDKLTALNSGADDYLSEPITAEELKARINAHFRRIIETQTSTLTNFYGNRLSMTVLKRVLSEGSKHASMLITLDNFKPYTEIYGTIAAEKLIQTYGAIVNSALSEDDFLGEISNGEFLVITTPEKAEKIAAYLIFAFDTVVEKFYSQKDAKNNYILCKNHETAEEKTALVKTRISIVLDTQKYKNVKALINTLLMTLKLTQTNKNSSYAVDRIKFPTNECINKQLFNNTVAIIEPDEALRFLLDTTAQIQGYTPIILDYDNNSINEIIENNPTVIIMDVGELEKKQGIDFCKKIKAFKNLKNTKIILTSNAHNKEEILNAGADIYLPKPYDLITLYNWVDRFIKEYNYW